MFLTWKSRISSKIYTCSGEQCQCVYSKSVVLLVHRISTWRCPLVQLGRGRQILIDRSGAQQQSKCTLLLLSINGTDRQTGRRKDGWTPCSYIDAHTAGVHVLEIKKPHRPDGSRVVSVLDSGAAWPGLKLQPRRCRVTVLGKLFTPIVPVFIKQRNWLQPS